MNIQWSFRNCSKHIKSEIRSYWHQKQSRIERLSSVIPFDVKKIRISVYFHPGRVNQYEARAVMAIPGRSLAVQSAEEMLNATLDKLADGLVAAIRKYKNSVQHTFRRQRKEQLGVHVVKEPHLLPGGEKTDVIQAVDREWKHPSALLS